MLLLIHLYFVSRREKLHLIGTREFRSIPNVAPSVWDRVGAVTLLDPKSIFD